MTVSEHVRDQSLLPPLLREFAILAVARSLNNEYEIHHHEPIARALGASNAQLSHLADWAYSTLYSEVERAVIGFAWEATVARHVSDDTAADVIKLLPADQVVELTLTIGWYHLCHVVIDSLGVEIES